MDAKIVIIKINANDIINSKATKFEIINEIVNGFWTNLFNDDIKPIFHIVFSSSWHFFYYF